MGAAAAIAPIAFGANAGLSSLVLGASIIGAGFSIFQGVQSLRAGRDQARAEESRQRQFSLQGVQRSNEILQQEIDAMAAINVSVAAGGGDPFSGSAVTVKDRIRGRANRQLRTAAVDTEFNIAASRSAQRQARRRGVAGFVGGISGAANTISSGASTLANIG